MSWMLQAAGGIVGAKGQREGAKADIANLGSQARIADAQAQADEEAQRRAGRQFTGAQAATMAEAGGGVDEGLARQSAVNSELDALNIRYGGRAKAYGLLSTARGIAKQTPYNVGATLLSSGGNAYQSYSASHP